MNKPSLLIFLLVTFLFSCKKEIFQFNFTEKKKLNIKELDFEYFQAKSKIKFDDGFENFSASANVRIKKDSVIWMSVSSSIGIEGLRAIIRTDSIFDCTLGKGVPSRESTIRVLEWFIFRYSTRLVTVSTSYPK